MKTKQFNLYSLAGILLILLFAQTRDALGDVNNDGTINVQDIIRVINIILGNDPPPTEYEIWAGNVNIDSEINIQDIVILVGVILKTLCPEENYSPCTDNLANCCLDTTCHSFEWIVDTLGVYGSRINDVAVIDENNILVVGLIYTADSTFNAARWDGEEWEFFEIYNRYAELYSIFYFSENDIWVTSHCTPLYWNGIEWIHYHLQNMGFDVCVGLDVWGTSSTNMYFVGYTGAVIHYDGDNFTQFESVTEVDLQDIDGTTDGEYVFIVGYDILESPLGNTVLQIHNDEVIELYYSDMYDQGLYGTCRAVEIIEDTVYIKIQHGIWKYNWVTCESSHSILDLCCPGHGGVLSIDSNSYNDIFMVNGVGVFFHYNGSTWNVEDWLDISRPTKLNDISFSNNFIAIVGHYWLYQTGLVIRGYRE